MTKFCPECGKPTIKYDDGGRVRDACSECNFVQYANTPVSVGALVLRDGGVLLVQHNHPSKIWGFPGGYVEQEEDLALSITREVQEEAGLDVKPIGIVAIRNLVKETRNELYIIFLCEPDPDQIPHSQVEDEILDAKFIPLKEIPDLNTTAFNKRIIEGYIRHKPEPMRTFDIENYMANAFMFGNI